LIGKIGRKIIGKKYNSFIPYKYDRYLRFLRYGMLGWVIYMSAKSGQLIFQDIDPYGALLGIFNIFRVFKIRRNSLACISCGACDRACPIEDTVQMATKDGV